MNKILSLISISLCLFSCGNKHKEIIPTQWDKSAIAEEVTQIMHSDKAKWENIRDRYYLHDSTLTLSDYAILYYGYEFTEDYDPFYINDTLQKAYEANDGEAALIYARADYRKTPCSLNTLFALYNIVDMIGGGQTVVGIRENGDSIKVQTTDLLMDKYSNIVNAILLSSSDIVIKDSVAKSKETAPRVLFESDIDNILQSVYGSKANDVTKYSEEIDGQYIVCTVERDHKDIEKYYFDITSILKKKNK